MTIYDPATCAAFLKTKDQYGDYSNFAGGMPIRINDIIFRTSEALYQACRFPEHADIQLAIIESKSPMSTKFISKKYKSYTRPDWINEDGSGGFRMHAMAWVLYAKLYCNYERFSKSLLESGDKPIVEISKKDAFWGAIPQADGSLIGLNHLGLMLTKMRDHLPEIEEKRKTSSVMMISMISSPHIPFNFLDGLGQDVTFGS